MSAVVRHVAESISFASRAHGDAARAAVTGAGAPMLERLARALGGAQHTPRPRAQRRLIVIVAGDHGTGDPGIEMGADHPTVIAAHAIVGGAAALSQLARAAHTPVIVIDAGAREPSHMPPSTVALGRGPTRDLAREPAMTIVDAALGLEAGIALAMSLAEPSPGSEGLALLAVGALGVGAEVASAALVGAITGRVPPDLNDPQAELAAHRGVEHRRYSREPITEPLPLLATGTGDLPRTLVTTGLEASALELLASFGGSETAVLAGLMLGLASINVPVILDSYATGSAAMIAAMIAPAVTGYLIAAHRGSFTMPAMLEHLGLQPIFEVGLGHGEGSGAAMVLPLVDQVSELATPRV
ncbi:MAG: nicotinate-nucleotide--dimethylbenzimidazole phosphoribosyltransferase [Kofleriaceae bacterium]